MTLSSLFTKRTFQKGCISQRAGNTISLDFENDKVLLLIVCTVIPHSLYKTWFGSLTTYSVTHLCFWLGFRKNVILHSHVYIFAKSANSDVRLTVYP